MKRYTFLIGFLFCFLASLGQDLEALLQQEQSKVYVEKRSALLALAGYYARKEAFMKAHEYWNKALQVEKSETGTTEVTSEYGAAETLYQSKQYSKSIVQYEKLLPRFMPLKDSTMLYTAWIHLIDCLDKTGNFTGSLNQYALLNKQIDLQKNSRYYIAQLNHRAVLETKLKKTQAASQYLLQANDIIQGNPGAIPHPLQREIQINLAIVYAIQGSYFQALTNLELAGKLVPITDTEAAYIANRKGAIYLLMKRYEDAEQEALFASELLKPNQSSIESKHALAESYELLEKVYNGRDQTKYKANQALYYDQQKTISETKQIAAQLELSRSIEIEKEEASIKEKINSAERENNYVLQLQLEKESARRNLDMKEQELQIQKQAEKLQLALLERKILAGKQTEQEFIIQKQQLQNDIQQQELDRQQLIRENQEKEIALALNEKLIFEKQLEADNNRLQYLRYIIILIGIVFVLSLVGLINLIRNRVKLKLLVEERTKQLVFANQELLQSNHQLEQYSYMTAHNLRGPVARLLGLSNIFEGMDAGGKKLVLDKVRSETIMLDELLKDMNQILQVKNAKDQLIESIEVSKSLNRIKNVLKEEIEESNATISTDFSQLHFISFVPPFFDNILYNLISNAIKYRHPDRLPAIEVTSFVDGAYNALRILDNGLGIDLEKHNGRVFGLYKRFHLQNEGKGIGLFMVKSQIESLGGKIDLQSTVNVGSQFTLYFPIPQVQ